MNVERNEDDPVRYLIDEMESFILKMAAEIDRLRARVQELEGGAEAQSRQVAARER